MGYLIRKTTLVEWMIFAVGTFLCYHPHITSDLLGIGLIALVYFWQRYKNKKDEEKAMEAPQPA